MSGSLKACGGMASAKIGILPFISNTESKKTMFRPPSRGGAHLGQQFLQLFFADAGSDLAEMRKQPPVRLLRAVVRLQ